MDKKIPNKINNIIQEFIQGVNNILGPRVKKIILYGSYARGDYNNSSDIDIMILTDLRQGDGDFGKSPSSHATQTKQKNKKGLDSPAFFSTSTFVKLLF